MAVKCAWCGAVIRKSERSDSISLSHGICEKCQNSYFNPVQIEIASKAVRMSDENSICLNEELLREKLGLNRSLLKMLECVERVRNKSAGIVFIRLVRQALDLLTKNYDNIVVEDERG